MTLSSVAIGRLTSGWRRIAASALLVVVCCDGGCSKSDFELAPAHGRVTLDGIPVSNAKVMFAPVPRGESSKAGRPAFGLLGPDGTFVLSTYSPDDGAIVGDHWVTVVRLTDEQEAGSSNLASADLAGWERVTYPERVSVQPKESNDFSITLTSEIAAKFGQPAD